MTSRIRVVGWNVAPVVMADDGENLTPVNVQPVMVPAAGWDAFKAGGDDQALANIAEQLAEQTAAPATNGAAPNRAARRAKTPA